MNSKALTIFLGLIATLAIASAAYLYASQMTGSTPDSKPTPTPSTSSSASPTAETSGTPTPSATASTTQTFSENQALSQPNDQQKIPEGGSLLSLLSGRTITVSELAKLNGIGDPNKVQAGQKIIIPDDVSSDTYTILFIINQNRLKKEQQKITSGATSIYSDAVTAAQADAKGIYGLVSDTPYSQSNVTETGVTLSTTDDARIVTIMMEKQASGLWTIKKLTIKTLTKATP
jgi:LysM repeat protein